MSNVFSTIFNYVWSEIKTYPRYAVLFVANVVVGFVGLATIQGFRSSVEYQLQSNSKSSVGADIVISSRMPITEEVSRIVEKTLLEFQTANKVGEAIEVYSMVGVKGLTRLAQLRAQDFELPFYGDVIVRIDDQTKSLRDLDLDSTKSVAVYREFIDQMKVKVGDSLTIGGQDFRILGVIEKDVTAQLGRGSLAPRVYIGKKSLGNLGLIQKGSTAFYQRLIAFAQDDELQLIEKELRDRIDDPAVNIRSHINATEANARLFQYLGDYLGIIALLAILLANIGIVYLFRAHLVDRSRDHAILKMIGWRPQKIVVLVVVQLLVLSTIGLLTAVAVAAYFPGVLAEQLSTTLAVPIEFQLNWLPLAGIVGIGILGIFLTTLPILTRIYSTSPQILLSATANDGGGQSEKSDYLWWIPAAIYFVCLTFWQANSFKLTGVFLGSLIALVFLFCGLYLLFFKFVEGRLRLHRFVSGYALREMIRYRLESLIVFVALSLASAFGTLIVVVEASIRNEISFSHKDERPSLFLFDIQDDQIDAVTELAKNLDMPLQNPSPLVRGRLLELNGAPYVRKSDSGKKLTREEQESERSRGWGFNLSERSGLSPSETITEGRFFKENFDESKSDVAEISVEEKFAERMGLKVGDNLVFEVVGVPLKAKVVSLRRVRWASFQPNFFVQFQGGVFAMTPKSWVASTFTVDTSKELEFQNRVVEQFPNVSILNVGRIVERMVEISSQMTTAAKAMAFLVLAAALVVAISLQIYHVQRFKNERTVLFLLGLAKQRIAQIENVQRTYYLSLSLIGGYLLGHVLGIPIVWQAFATQISLQSSGWLFFGMVLVPVLGLQILLRIKHH
jgi:putative ABC transport system permease protein